MGDIATSNPDAATEAGLPSLWRHPDFRKLWAGETVSLFGSQITLLALPLTAVLELRATPAQMGILGAAGYLPFLLLALIAGVWVDRHRRRPILIAANLGRASLLGFVPILAAFGELSIEVLIVIAFLVGLCTVFFELAYQSFLPRLVAPEQLVEANGKLSATASLAEIGGPGLAGILVDALSAPVAIAFDALSFLVSAAALSRVRRPEPAPSPAHVEGIGKEIGEGFRETVHNRYLLAFAGEAATYNMFWSAIDAILVLYAVRKLGIGAGALGVLLAIGSVGALLGAALTGRAAKRFGLGTTIVSASVLGAVSPLLMPLAHGRTILAPSVLAIALFVRGFGVTGCNVHVWALRQAITPDRLLGRTNAVYRLITYGVVPLGALLGGFLGEQIGLRAALLVGTIGVACSWPWLFFSPARRLRELPTTAGAAAPGE